MSQKLSLYMETIGQIIHSVFWVACVFAMVDYVRVFGIRNFYAVQLLWSVYCHVASFCLILIGHIISKKINIKIR